MIKVPFASFKRKASKQFFVVYLVIEMIWLHSPSVTHCGGVWNRCRHQTITRRDWSKCANSICPLKQNQKENWQSANWTKASDTEGQRGKDTGSLSLFFFWNLQPAKAALLFFFLALQLRDLCVWWDGGGSAAVPAERRHAVCQPSVSHGFPIWALFRLCPAEQRKISAPKSEIVCFSFELILIKKNQKRLLFIGIRARSYLFLWMKRIEWDFFFFKTRQMRKMGGTGARTDGTEFRGHLFCRWLWWKIDIHHLTGDSAPLVTNCSFFFLAK